MSKGIRPISKKDAFDKSVPHDFQPTSHSKPSCGFQEFAIFQYFTPFSTPQPTMRTACPPAADPETCL